MHLKRFITTKEVKNTYGYLRTQRVYELAKALLLFALAAGIYALGYISTKSNKNLLTIVAVLGCLPASQFTVRAIMFYKYHDTSEKVHEALSRFDGEFAGLYDLVFTSEKVIYEISYAAYRAGSLQLFSENRSIDANACERHVSSFLRRAGIADVHVKVYTDLEEYVKRLDKMVSLEEKSRKRAGEVMQVLKEITL